MPVWEGVYNSSSEEKKLMKEHSEDSQRSINLAYLAGTTTLLFFFPRNYHNNNGDAFRHCFWSSIIAKEISPEWAHTWVMAHEADASLTNIHRLMDEYNNNQGINIFKNNPNASAGEQIGAMPATEQVEAPTECQRQLMSTLDITFLHGVYRLGTYRYDRLADAIAYARLGVRP